MARISKILVPVDGSEGSLAAHRLALETARAFAAEIILLYVVDSSALDEICRLSGGERPQLLSEMQESGMKLLLSLSQEAQQQGVGARVDIQTGMPDEVILDEAIRQEAGLIVMGKIGRKRHRRSLLGSVTERILEASELPVLVVSPRQQCKRRPVASGGRLTEGRSRLHPGGQSGQVSRIFQFSGGENADNFLISVWRP